MWTKTSLAVLAFAAGIAQALPDVTPVPLTPGCASWPNYAPQGFPDPFYLFADSTDSPLADPQGGLTVGALDSEGIALNRLSIATRRDLAKSMVSCEYRAGWGDMIGVHFTWNPITLGPSAESLFLLEGEYKVTGSNGIRVDPYHHFYANGTQQAGLFVGGAGVTTWGFLRELNSNGIDQYRIRLLVPGAAPLEDGEFKGFIIATAEQPW